MDQKVERGVVKWFDEEKGYGFITSSSESKKDYFVHRSNIEDMGKKLDDGQMVEFVVGKGQKGPIAQNVRSLVDQD
jgi:cold shock protein